MATTITVATIPESHRAGGLYAPAGRGHSAFRAWMPSMMAPSELGSSFGQPGLCPVCGRRLQRGHGLGRARDDEEVLDEDSS
jgi:hypothetical protein